MVLFWSFAALIFNPREAKRLLGLVGGAGTVACILTGFLLRPYVAYFGVDNLLVLVAVLLIGFAVAVTRLVQREGGYFQSVTTGPRWREQLCQASLLHRTAQDSADPQPDPAHAHRRGGDHAE